MKVRIITTVFQSSNRLEVIRQFSGKFYVETQHFDGQRYLASGIGGDDNFMAGIPKGGWLVMEAIA